MNRHWYLVAQSGGARLFEQEGVREELSLLRRFENPEGKLKTSAIVSDRQGRSETSSKMGHNAMGANDGPREHVIENFIHRVADFLNTEAEQDEYMDLVLVAEPHILGEIRKFLGKAATRRLRDPLSKNLAHIPDQEIMPHLTEALCKREEIRA